MSNSDAYFGKFYDEPRIIYATDSRKEQIATAAGGKMPAWGNVVHLNQIGNHTLFSPMSIIIEEDDGSVIARTPDIPMLYGSGDSPFEAVEMLKREIMSLKEDVNVDDSQLGEQLVAVKRYLARIMPE